MAKSTDQRYGTLVITGGSSGIGYGILKGFRARYPDAHCINLSRTCPPADVTDARLSHIETDLSQRAEVARALEQTRSLLKKYEGPVLFVYSSGVGQHERFQNADPTRNLLTIDLNISAAVHLAQGLLPELLPRGGCIATVSSTSAFQPTSMMATYGATKTFLMHWTLALGEDLRGTGLRTLALCPGGTLTPFLKKAGFNRPVRSYWPLMSIEQVTEAFFRGLDSGKSLVVPGFVNAAVAALSKLAPIRLSTRVATHIMRRAKT